MRRRSWRRSRLRRWVLGLLLIPLVLSVLAVLLLRVVPPPITAFMLQHVAVNAGASQPVPLQYRWVPLEQISGHALTAVVAAEDQRFAEHGGLDYKALRLAWAHNRDGGAVRGGSTITQQVAKNLFLWPAQSLLRKGVEAYFALLIELLWPKARIIEVYLNIAQFGDGIYGVGAASERFFGKRPDQLTAAEAALLAAVLPNPVRFRVERPSAHVVQRQHWILRQMRYLQIGPAGVPAHR